MKKPKWLLKRLPTGGVSQHIESELSQNGLHTICQEACCPNMGECFSMGIATFLILGNRCTRNCRFCAVAHGIPSAIDFEEPKRLADEVKRLGLRFVVVTSVTRDDLHDGGANQFKLAIAALHDIGTGVQVEVLIPDFMGSETSLEIVVQAGPEVINHNIETVPRLYRDVRPGAEYRRSLDVLQNTKKQNSTIVTKSGMMVGLGESEDEIYMVMEELREVGCQILTIGQYLCPSSGHYPLREYVPLETFDRYRQKAIALGFIAVASGPFVRSSYKASEHYESVFNSTMRGEVRKKTSVGRTLSGHHSLDYLKINNPRR